MNNYYYFAASLPMIEFGSKPPFSYKEFLLASRYHLPDRDFDIINEASIKPKEHISSRNEFLKKWDIFNRSLANELVKRRSEKFSKDASKYIKGEHYTDPFTGSFAEEAMQLDILDGELFLDKVRWAKIEELKRAHYFDIDYLTAYVLELQIMERWLTIKEDKKADLLENILTKG